MNTANVYDINTIRSKSEAAIRNDPFDLGNTMVKGLTRLNHNRNLADYAERLVAEYASYHSDEYHLDLLSLPEDEQNELSRLYIESTGRDIAECINGDDFSIDNNYTCALLSMLKNDCKETRENFAEITRKNIITYYTESLQEVLDDACNSHLSSVNNENGYYAHTDNEHGDVVWSKC